MFTMTGSAEGQVRPSPDERRLLDARDRDELRDFARATWKSFEWMVGLGGLPADRLQRDDQGSWKPSKRTTPSDIASYLWSTLAAQALGLIDHEEADRRIGETLATLAHLERDRGFFFEEYDLKTGARSDLRDGDRSTRPFVSSVDNGWLAAALMMVGHTRMTLRVRAETLLAPMDFGLFFVPYDPAHPVEHPGHFHGGYYQDDRKPTAFYGMLNTEPRIISYVAIARGQVPAEHYFRLFRTLPADRGRQQQVPKGEFRSYFGVPVFEGHYEYRGLDIVPSWGGSMFEALMVPLFVPEEEWAPLSWGVNHPLYARAQLEQGLDVMHYGFWGFSPSRVPEGGYQTYGVNDLGTEVDGYFTFEFAPATKAKPGLPIGPPREGVVTPHASFLAFRYLPRESLANIRALIKSFPILGPAGFFDSVNVTTGEVSDSVLALDQGMILVAIANALADDALRQAFIQGPIEGRIRPLIAPEIFTAGDSRR